MGTTVQLHRRFGATYCLHLQGDEYAKKATSKTPGCYHEDGGTKFLRNIGNVYQTTRPHTQNYSILHGERNSDGSSVVI
jgi:hypothetical protein